MQHNILFSFMEKIVILQYVKCTQTKFLFLKISKRSENLNSCMGNQKFYPCGKFHMQGKHMMKSLSKYIQRDNEVLNTVWFPMVSWRERNIKMFEKSDIMTRQFCHSLIWTTKNNLVIIYFTFHVVLGYEITT